MHCRMCSQRLPRPGRLCRECEQELNLARSARPQGGFAQGPRPDELLLIGASPWLRMPSRPVVVVAAFAVGLSAAAAVYAIHASWGTAGAESVMIDRPAGRAGSQPKPARRVGRERRGAGAGRCRLRRMRTIRRATRSRSCRRPRVTRSIACWAWPTRSTTALASRCLRAWPARRGPALVIATAPRPASLSARIRLAANKLQPVTRDCAKCAIAASRMQCAPVRSRRVHPAVDGEARIAERSRRHATGITSCMVRAQKSTSRLCSGSITWNVSPAPACRCAARRRTRGARRLKTPWVAG